MTTESVNTSQPHDAEPVAECRRIYLGNAMTPGFPVKIRHASARRARGHTGMLLCVILGVAGGLSLGGCANWTEVKVDSFAKPNARDAISYQLHDVDPASHTDALRHREAVGFVRTALSGKGMYEAPPGAPADLIVDLDYGISPPQHRYKIAQEPIYGDVPGDPIPVSQTVGSDSTGYYDVTVPRLGPSTKGVVGFREVHVAVDIYEKHLRLSAHENKASEGGKPAPDVWTVDVTSEGEVRDLRKSLPFLAAATLNYIGKDSHGQKIIRLKDTDKDVSFVKRGM